MTYRKIVALLLLTIALAGCAKYKQEIWLYPDGSAKLHGEQIGRASCRERV